MIIASNANCNEKNIDSDQKVLWYWKIVGSKDKKMIIGKQIFGSIFFEITEYKKNKDK